MKVRNVRDAQSLLFSFNVDISHYWGVYGQGQIPEVCQGGKHYIKLVDDKPVEYLTAKEVITLANKYWEFRVFS